MITVENTYYVLMALLVTILLVTFGLEVFDMETNHNELWVGFESANLCAATAFGVFLMVVTNGADASRQRVYIAAMVVILLLSSLHSIACIQYHEDHARPSISELMAVPATGPPVVATVPFYANHYSALLTATTALVLGLIFTIATIAADHLAKYASSERNRHIDYMHNYMLLSLVLPLACLADVTGRSPGDSGIGVNSAYLCQFSSVCPLSLQM